MKINRVGGRRKSKRDELVPRFQQSESLNHLHGTMRMVKIFIVL